MNKQKVTQQENGLHGNTISRCNLVGIGAWGPGFNNWQELKTHLLNKAEDTDTKPITPKPAIIPANERRRSPLPVKIAVETSWQAAQQSTIAPQDMACVFGSGLGDTDITNYMCRALNSELKQLSPTKFHNSVHNAAAGYWTISTGCMKSANSIAAYHNTAGLALLEGISQSAFQNEIMLITLFDDKAHNAYRDIFACDTAFSAALIVTPHHMHQDKSLATIALSLNNQEYPKQELNNAHLNTLYQQNPAAKILSVLEVLANIEETKTAANTRLAISENTHVALDIELPNQQSGHSS